MYKRVGVVIEVDGEGVVLACSTTLMMVAASSSSSACSSAATCSPSARRSRRWSATATAATRRARSSRRSTRCSRPSTRARSCWARPPARCPARGPDGTAPPTRLALRRGPPCPACDSVSRCTEDHPDGVTLRSSPRRYRWSRNGSKVRGEAAWSGSRSRGGRRRPSWRTARMWRALTWCAPSAGTRSCSPCSPAPSARVRGAALEGRLRVLRTAGLRPRPAAAGRRQDPGLCSLRAASTRLALRAGAAPPATAAVRRQTHVAGRRRLWWVAVWCRTLEVHRRMSPEGEER